jgi:uncharacterized protein YkwD
MRCSYAFMFLIHFGLLPMIVESQDVKDSSPKSIQELPNTALKSQYRIQILAVDMYQIEQMRKVATDFSAKYRQNTYTVRNGSFIQLHTGDYSEKKFAKLKLTYLKRDFKRARIIKAMNDSVIEFSIYGKKKPVKSTPPKGSIDGHDKVENKPENNLVDYPEWNAPEYLIANSANNEDYLTTEEKQIYYYLNLARMNPKLFAETYLKDLKESTDYFESSLYQELQKLKPLPILKPNRQLYESAHCHAKESGERGFVGHERFKCKEYFMGECIQYGESDALKIIIRLLVDKSTKSLGHRRICLGTYKELGVAIEPHKTFEKNAVLDFN